MIVDGTPPDVQAAIAQHNLIEGFAHTNLIANQCLCASYQAPTAKRMVERPRPSTDDEGLCFNCGGLTRRTGTCHTCTECGSTTGCG